MYDRSEFKKLPFDERVRSHKQWHLFTASPRHHAASDRTVIGGKTFHRLVDVGLDCEGIEIVDAEFSRSILSESSFKGSILSWASFESATLKNVNFSNCKLNGACFVGADLQGADFSNSNLEFVDFSFADLRRVDFTGASLVGCHMGQANLVGAKTSSNFRDVDFYARAKFSSEHYPWLALNPKFVNYLETLVFV